MSTQIKSSPLLTGIETMLSVAERVLMSFACTCLAIQVVINAVNLVFRNVVGHSLGWVWPWTGTLMMWSVFSAFFVLYRRKLDIAVEIVLARTPSRWRPIADVMINIVGIITVSVIVIEAPVILNRQVGHIQFVGLERYALTVPLIVSSVLIAIHLLTDSIHTLRGGATNTPDQEPPRWSL